MICCPNTFGKRSGERKEEERGFRGEERGEQEREVGGKREREELTTTTPSTSVLGRGGFRGEEKTRGGGREDYDEEFPVFSGTFFPVSDEFP